MTPTNRRDSSCSSPRTSRSSCGPRSRQCSPETSRPPSTSARYDLADLIDLTSPTEPQALDLPIQTATRGELENELELPLAGLYPVSVDLRLDGRRIDRHITFVERLPSADAPPGLDRFNLTIVAGIDDPGPEPDASTWSMRMRGSSSSRSSVKTSRHHSQPCSPRWSPASSSPTPHSATESASRSPATRPWRCRRSRSTPRLPWPRVRSRRSRGCCATARTCSPAAPATATRRTAWPSLGAVSTAGREMLRNLGVQLLVQPFDQYAELDGSIPQFTDTSKLLLGALADDTTLSYAVVDPVNEMLDPDRETVRHRPRPPSRCSPNWPRCGSNSGPALATWCFHPRLRHS